MLKSFDEHTAPLTDEERYKLVPAVVNILKAAKGRRRAVTNNDIANILRDEGRKPAPQEPEDGQEDNNGEEQRDDTRYYKIEALVSIEDNASENENDNGEYSYDFLVKTKDVDTAKVVITAWINNKFREQAEEGKYARLSIISASPFSCNSIIEKDFCLAYKEEEYTE